VSPTIAFLGAGNMAAAMVDGLLASRGPEALICHTASGRSAQALGQRTGIRVAATLEELLGSASVLVVAFKPQHLASADPKLAALSQGKLVLSVLAGKKLATLERSFPRARNIVRSMPNTPSRIGAGMTGWCALRALDPSDRDLVQNLLAAMGREIEIPENRMDALTAVSGSGPAYVFEFAAALRDAGVAQGLDPALAETLAMETILGAGRLMARRAIAPEKLRDEVTSPNGTTFAGLKRLAAGNFRELIAETVKAARARAEEMSRD
jgi:pyrroline-5-carboxylate reductase